MQDWITGRIGEKEEKETTCKRIMINYIDGKWRNDTILIKPLERVNKINCICICTYNWISQNKLLIY